jgi:hypothetical protein
MTTLKISDRTEILRIVLTKAFEPKFNTIRDRIKAQVQAQLVKDHPHFCALLARPESAQYLAVGKIRNVLFTVDGVLVSAGKPRFGLVCSLPMSRYYYTNSDAPYSSISDDDTVVPSCWRELTVNDKRLTALYIKTWADYSAAQSKLWSLLNSYTSQEKLAVDFPEYARFAEKPESKVKLPVVIVKDVREELAKLGVPAK